MDPGALRSNPCYLACVEVLNKFHIEHTVERGKKHPRIVFTFRGVEMKKTFAGTPGDKIRGPEKAAADVRRLIRLAERRAPKKAPERVSVSKPEPAPAPSRDQQRTETMQDSTAIALKSVQFRGSVLETFERGGQPFVVLKPIVEGMGLDWNGQFQRVKRDPVLGSTMCVTHTVGADGRRREMLCLPLRMLNGFLFGVDASRVRRAIQEQVIGYQRECYDALAAYWMEGAAVNPRAGSGDGELVRRIDGIARMVSHKVTEIERMAKDLTADRSLVSEVVQKIHDRLNEITASSGSAEDSGMVSAYRILGMAEVPDGKRYAGLYSLVSKEIRDYCGLGGYRMRIVDLEPGKRWEFDREAAIAWLEAGGRADIWRRINAYWDRKRGQSVIRFPDRQEPSQPTA